MNNFLFLIISVCVNSFTLFIFIVYYGNLFGSFNDKINKKYDYIIVGSGTAGSLIAHRLATETNFTFIVLEAGGPGNLLFEIPVLGPLLHGSPYDWQYETVPQDNACLAMKNKKCRLIQGKIVGGSSKLNNMVHVRGNLSHYASWFHHQHSEHYLKKQFEFVEKQFLHIDNVLYKSELANAIVSAAIELGYETNNGQFTTSRLSQYKGKRWSLSDKVDSKHVVTNALVSKILVKDNVAYGVKVLKFGKEIEVHARKGVIVSAGTYNSPKLLQLSGIGPKSLLNFLNIPLVQELPVGEHLQEHVATGLDLLLFNTSLRVNALNVLNLMNVYEYFINGQGPFTSPGCEAVGFLSTKGGKEPDLQFMVLPVGIASDGGSHLMKLLGLYDEVWDSYFAKLFDKHTATILPIVLHPKSKGKVYINSRDPNAPPQIDPKYFEEKEDLDVLRNGVKKVLQFINTQAIQDIGGFVNTLPFPGCERYVLFSDDYLDCYIRHLTLTSYHPVGTCSMGISASNSVVDTSFRVHGVRSLYVVDGSVLPTLPSGNINAAIAMMANLFFNKIIKSRNCNACYKGDIIYEYIYDICLQEKM
ncbi:glucose dehydrogenase [FAD, quinone]-like [Leguminivora glycinivorella]|uniref:glucose dehydrogenase [FAD, quinone]-like n=1 Tax=Leguminivora glycinivorella TaxID=1035111 RepID=UPI00200CDFFA|nr:glucose dehydrogenase [FAD, quinone]-like [Leguminivora glycinivorella]